MHHSSLLTVRGAVLYLEDRALQHPFLPFDDLIGLDIEATADRVIAKLTLAHQLRIQEQLMGIPVDQPPRLPSGLSPYRRLPAAEPGSHVRARMAQLIAQRVSAAGAVTREDLVSGGFDDAQIARHFAEAVRCARAERMAV